MSWLTGNLVIDWAGIGGTTFCVGGFVAFCLWALRDKLRRGAGDHQRPNGDSEVAAPAPRVRPFAGKRKAAGK